MKQLPSEILVKIFLYLHPKNKIDCMLVCQHWKNLIQEFAHYHTLDIHSGKAILKLIAIVKENPGIGKKVEHLTIAFRYLHPSPLLVLLPNIRTLRCSDTEPEKGVTTEEGFHTWSRHVELINLITPSLQLYIYYPKLTIIDLDCLSNRIIRSLKYAPALIKLRLRTASLTFDNLEALHKNTQCLTSFTICRLTLKISDFSYPIKPAISITECRFEEVEVKVTWGNLETVKQLLIYASEKYPNLSNFTFTFFSENHYNDEIKKITYSDWLPLLQNLGPKLKKLLASTNGWADDAFDILDRCNCQIECLRICRLSSTACMNMVQSRQIEYIQTLVLCNIDVNTFGWLNKLQKLKKLKLFYSPHKPQQDIGLDDILDNSPPTLRSLSLYKVHLTANRKYVGLSNIKCLSFDNLALPEGTGTFLSKHFPKLTNLKLKQCNIMEKMYNLEKIHLFNFTYQALFLRRVVDCLLIVSSSNDKRRCYTFYRDSPAYTQDNGLYAPVKSQPQSETDIKPDFFLLCHSLTRCKLK